VKESREVGDEKPNQHFAAAIGMIFSSVRLAYFPFDNDRSNVTGYGLEGRTINGDVGLTAGLAGHAASFDGGGAAVEVDGLGSLPIDDELTVEFWVNLNPKLSLTMATWYKKNQAFSGSLDEVRVWDRALSHELMRERAGAFIN